MAPMPRNSRAGLLILFRNSGVGIKARAGAVHGNSHNRGRQISEKLCPVRATTTAQAWFLNSGAVDEETLDRLKAAKVTPRFWR